MYRLRFVVPLLVVGLLSSGFLLGQGKKTDKEPIIVSKRLPNNYKQLGLSTKQKNEIYRIHAKYAVEIEKLKQQLEALREQEKVDTENVLTAAQKARLREIRGGGSDSDKEVDKPTPAKNREIKDKPAQIKKK